jgi:hypothetical protein
MGSFHRQRSFQSRGLDSVGAGVEKTVAGGLAAVETLPSLIAKEVGGDWAGAAGAGAPSQTAHPVPWQAKKLPATPPLSPLRIPWLSLL